MNRRSLLLGGTALAGFGALALGTRNLAFGNEGEPVPGTFEVSMTDDEWRKKLTPEQFDVLRRQGTEYPGTSPLLSEHRAGIFSCAGCDLALFDAGDVRELPYWYGDNRCVATFVGGKACYARDLTVT